MILVFLLSRAALPANSRISALKYWSTCTNTLGIVAFAKKTVNTTDRELKPCSG